MQFIRAIILEKPTLLLQRVPRHYVDRFAYVACINICNRIWSVKKIEFIDKSWHFKMAQTKVKNKIYQRINVTFDTFNLFLIWRDKAIS